MLTATRRGADRRREVRCLIPRLPVEAEIVLLEAALVSTPRGSEILEAGARYSTSHADASRLVALGAARWLRPREARS